MTDKIMNMKLMKGKIVRHVAVLQSFSNLLMTSTVTFFLIIKNIIFSHLHLWNWLVVKSDESKFIL